MLARTSSPPVYSATLTSPAERSLRLLPVVLLAVVALWWPESGDEALFIRTAQQLRHGAVYYRDYWDIKQPGIYWFYQLGESIYSGGLGARLLESLLAVVAGGLVSFVTAEWNLRRSVRFGAPTIVLGPYLIYSYLTGVGQVEGLMNVLLLTVLAGTWPNSRRLRPNWAWFIAGLAVGAIAVSKTLYLLIPLTLVIPAVVLSFRIDRRATVTRGALALVGALAPLAAAVGYFVDHGVLKVALRTTFQLPAQVAILPSIHDSDPWSALAQAVGSMFLVVGPLAVVAVITARRRGVLAICLALSATAVTEFVLAVPQLWTPYRWLMFAMPLGLLAVGGLEVALSWLRNRQRNPAPAPWVLGRGIRYSAGLAVIALSVPLAWGPAKVFLPLANQRWGLNQAAWIARGENLPPITSPIEVAAAVRSRIAPGTPIYVLGDPRISTLLHAVPAAQVAGWASAFPPSVWAELSRELNYSRPRFIFVDGRDWSSPRTGPGKPVFDLLGTRYTELASTVYGTWYWTAHPGRGMPEPGGLQLLQH